MLKENEQLKKELTFEQQHYLYENWYKELKEKMDYLIEKLKKVFNKLPNFIKTIVDRVFSPSGMQLKYFKQQYDEDYIKEQETERLGRKIKII